MRYREGSQYVRNVSSTNRAPENLNHEPEAVKYARRRAGLSQAALARKLGVARSLVNEIEGGTRNATPAMLIKLAEALGCPVVVLERKRPVEARFE